ncbi:unnamed protein product, partial [Iphiclides podalirius]
MAFKSMWKHKTITLRSHSNWIGHIRFARHYRTAAAFKFRTRRFGGTNALLETADGAEGRGRTDGLTLTHQRSVAALPERFAVSIVIE